MRKKNGGHVKNYFECDNLRNRYTDEKDEKKLKFLDEINEFVEKIQKKYEQA